ncbi:hypothetical protein LMG27952_06898 [Paraburkholderia hiiakae]|uniref:Uncharacterized protein n=1 Tax=Paraburkholderia hiiakae TaxID=1081782 RepID=A0ABM8P919_9BURK|nr:hypothetical protein [Paraburkholderia hiiakae]CAD6559570.1 hypothetical protein LMG27952_06898 [Paraburkholderia hiiakae]
MDNASPHRRFFAHAVRIEHIVHLDAALCDDMFFGALRDLISQDLHEMLEVLSEGGLRFKRLSQIACFDELEQWLARLAWKLELGFLVKARQPYFIVDGKGCFGYSWELSRARWFFRRDYASAVNAVHEWAAHNHAEAHARLQA